MRTFAQTSKADQQTSSARTTPSARTHFGQRLEVDSILQLRRTIGNQAVRQLLRGHSRGVSGDSRTPEIIHFRHDLNRVPSHAPTTIAAKPEVTTGDRDPIAQDFGTLRILPIRAPAARAESHADIPVTDTSEAEIVDQPVGPGVTPAAPAPAASDSCGQPRSMQKVTSGPFLGGLTMDSYYPDLAGTGTYSHPGSGGTFDTGSRVGANIQLNGFIPIPCLSNPFQLEQTVTRTRYRINGVVHAEEGRTFDDIAKSGRAASGPPFRQEFTAGVGYVISMADPPSTGYHSTSNIEHDRDFVTSLVGPNGRQSVSWSLSTRISGGAVTKNVLT